MDSVYKTLAFHLADEVDDIAFFVTAETVEGPPGGAHGKRRGLLFMEGAQPDEVCTGAFELDILAHDLHDVRALSHLCDDRFGDP